MMSRTDIEAEERSRKFDEEEQRINESYKKEQDLINSFRAKGLKDEEIGVELFKMGLFPHVTTDISESLSIGYGEGDEYGFWQIPAPKEAYKNFE